MKIIKYILYILLAIIGLALIVAIFVPKEKTVGSEITMAQPAQKIYNYVKYVKNQENFGYWNLQDPNMKKQDEGTDGQIGYKYIWKSEVVGDGTQTLVGLEEGKKVETELDFGFGDPARSTFVLTPISENETKVAYGIHLKSFYPANITFLLFDMTEAFEISLQNLKKIMEQP